jgi:hypothetical protein
MTTATTRASGTIRVHPKNASQMILSRLWIVPREVRIDDAGGVREARAEEMPMASRCQSRGNRLLPPPENKNQWTKNPKMTTKGTKGATRSFKMLQRSSTSSLGEMETSVPGGNKNCFSGRSCPSSWRHHNHSAGQRCPSRSPAMISG